MHCGGEVGTRNTRPYTSIYIYYIDLFIYLFSYSFIIIYFIYFIYYLSYLSIFIFFILFTLFIFIFYLFYFFIVVFVMSLFLRLGRYFGVTSVTSF